MASKKKRAVILIIAVALLLIIYVLIRNLGGAAAMMDGTGNTAVEIYGIQETDIQSISFLIDGEEAVFEQNEGGWSYKQDQNFPVNENQIHVVTDELLSVKAERVIENVDNLSEYGLDEPTDVIVIMDIQGDEHRITIGAVNETSGYCYAYLDGEEAVVYVIDSDFSTVFSGSLMNYAEGESFPDIIATDIDKIEIESENSLIIIEKSDNNKNKWIITNNNENIMDADIEKTENIKSLISGFSYDRFYEYYCEDYSAYGLEEPHGTITVEVQDTSMTAAAEELTSDEEQIDQSEQDEEQSGQSEQNGQNATRKIVLRIGDEDGNGGRYVSMEGSTEVHSISLESLTSVLDLDPAEMENMYVSQVDIAELSNITVSHGGVSHVFVKREQVSNSSSLADESETGDQIPDDESDGEISTDAEIQYDYTLDGQIFDNEAGLEAFVREIADISAQEKTDEIQSGEAELQILLGRTDGTIMILSYYPYDTNFYLVTRDQEAFLVNKMNVRGLLEIYEQLISE